MGVAVLPHGGFLKKERLKLSGAANIAICGRPSWGRHLTLQGTVVEFLAARIAFLTRGIGRCGSADYTFANDTAETRQDSGRKWQRFDIPYPVPSSDRFSV
jgi:hypothetical protein